MPPPAPVIRTRFIWFLLPSDPMGSSTDGFVNNHPRQKSPPIGCRSQDSGLFILLQCKCLKIGNHQNVSGLQRRSERKTGSNSRRTAAERLRGRSIGASARAAPILTQRPELGGSADF